MCKESAQVEEADEPPQAIPGNEAFSVPMYRHTGPLTKSKRGYVFLLVITDRFTKLARVVPLRKITAYNVAVAFVEHWVFSYGPPECVISDNGKQFAAKFFQAVCELLGISNVFTSTYHPQTNGQVERYNRTILAMLRNYVNEHQNDWDEFASVLTYAYNNHVIEAQGQHNSTWCCHGLRRTFRYTTTNVESGNRGRSKATTTSSSLKRRSKRRTIA